ncbi:MAG: sensor histidine kinase [Anaerolineae bacterium]|nr:sensor histidine kinase [Anaerolineae bacterium]
MEQRPYIEPGLLPVFRLLTAIRLGLMLFTAVVGVAQDIQVGVSGRMHWFLINCMDAPLLLLYLSWPRLQRWLKGIYLPVGILLASLGPILIQQMIALQTESTGLRDVIRAWQLLPSLMIPLIIIAWQYNFMVVLVYCLGLTVLDIVLSRLFISSVVLRLIIPLSEGHSTTLFLGLLGVLLNRMAIFIAVGFMVSRLMKTQREQQAALRQANAKLTHYATTLEHLTVSHERNRLARELHDTLAHTLSALAVQLGAVDALWDDAPDKAHVLLSQSLCTTRNGLTETRRALQDLRAAPLDDLGLTLALRALAESVTARNGLTVDVSLPKNVDSLSPPVEQCIYRVAQEALVNATQHAIPQRVIMCLEETETQVILTIKDDGQGFDLENMDQEALSDLEHHFGLRGMRERAEMIGAQLTITSEPGKGTTVRLNVRREL